MKKLISAALLFAVLLLVITGTAVLREHRTAGRTGEYAVRLNEIEQLAAQGNNTEAARCAAELRKDLQSAETENNDRTVWLMCGVCLLFLGGSALYFGCTVFVPFRRLSGFAERVACGDLDTPLQYRRNDLFGRFTWGLDSMRQEIRRARACEQEAIENNKTVIASLSHDIKTPVASVRAYAEALELGMDGNPEKRAQYIGTILRKCDDISQLTDDMLTHALTELNRLHMEAEQFDLGEVLGSTLPDLSAGANDLHYEKPSEPVLIVADRSRIEQLTGNLVNNARKYAQTDIRVTLTQDADTVSLRVRDYGTGIPDSELPFVFGKFYRGSNAKEEKGAGLGLYIVRYIAEQSGGSVSLKNCAPGLEVTVSLPAAKSS
ncbi:MAG: HAMP domain-containing histidine kinase [Oscillospiraceae bacterium]|nr:HAMP domain-containing histidine kinase [Oscillospiraceae bacterium]